MLKFRSTSSPSQRPRNYLARREQRRLLLLVMMLGLVLLLMGKAADLNTWKRLGFGGDGDTGDDKSQAVAPQPREYDTRVRPTTPQRLPLDTFIATGKKKSGSEHEDYFPGVQPEYLQDVRDHSHFRPAEHQAWFNLLGVLQETPAEQLRKASRGPVGFVQLYEQPSVYRGHLVDVSGAVKRAFDIKPPPNDLGVDQYYQLWLFPEGGPVSPMMVYCLELPDGFPSSRRPDGEYENISEHVALTGFCFKNQAYSTGSQLLSSPLILAKTIRWQRRPPTVEPEPVPLEWIGGIIAGTALMALAIATWIFRSSDPKATAAIEKRYGTAVSPAEVLKDADLGPDVNAQLQALAEAHGGSAEGGEQPGQGSESSSEPTAREPSADQTESQSPEDTTSDDTGPDR